MGFKKTSRVVVAALTVGMGVVAADIVGSVGATAGAPVQDVQGAINGLVPVSDSFGQLRRDASGNLLGIRMGEPATSVPPASNAVRETRSFETRLSEFGEWRTVETVEVFVDPSLDPYGGKRLESIPGTQNVGR